MSTTEPLSSSESEDQPYLESDVDVIVLLASEHGEGALPSPPDTRDYVFDRAMSMARHRNTETITLAARPKIPKKVDHRSKLQRVRSQGKQGSCAAQTAAAMKEFQENISVKFDQHMSPQFIYNLRSNAPESGMHGRDVMDILRKYGSCRETVYPYNTAETRDQPKDQIPQRVLDEAKQYKVASYARVDSLEALKESLYHNGPCYIAFPCYNHEPEFWIPRTEKEKEERRGGHAVCVVGYDDGAKHFMLRNSWGADWGDDGYTYYPYDQWGAHWDCWTTVDGDSPFIDYIKPPQPKDTQSCKCVIL